jgi:hypothetical protein
MPKRSNDFQVITYLVKKCLSADAVVEESAMLADRLTGAEREVDVTVRQSIAGDEVVVSIECVDHTRPADVGWVEKMGGKHEHLPTDKLVLASRSGFTRGALVAAHKRGFVTASLQDSESTLQTELEEQLNGLWVQSFTLTVRDVRAVLETTDGDLVKVAVLPRNDVLVKDGALVGDVDTLVASYVSSQRMSERIHEAADQTDPTKCDTAEVGVSPGLKDGDDTIPLYMQAANGELHRIVSLHISCSFTMSNDPVDLRPATLGDTGIAWGRQHLAGGDCLMVATSDAEGLVKIALKGEAGEAVAHFIE